jgi:hypothetical protein
MPTPSTRSTRALAGYGGVPSLPATVVTPGVCVDFSGYADDTKFGSPFSLNNYQFTGLGAEPFVNCSGSVVGLQFTDAGPEINLAGPASAVTLDVVSFTSMPLTLSAINSSGVAVANASAPGDRIFQRHPSGSKDLSPDENHTSNPKEPGGGIK